MPHSKFGTGLKSRIQEKYSDLGYALGWRLLYSPEAVLERARVAFVGLNPGGDHAPADHAEFAMESGSAYAQERWGKPPGQSRLQCQVLRLFEIVGEPPADVLAGNLVPFRSPSWEMLGSKDQALRFGRGIWDEILAHTKPQLVIGMGGDTWPVLKQLLRVQSAQKELVGWGSVRGERGEFEGGTFVGLPHLSRFAIVTREESRKGLQTLLGTHYGR